MEYFKKDERSAFDAKSEAQELVWGPIAFQAAKVLRDLGILEAVKEKKDQGASIEEVASEKGVSYYGARVLMEASLGMRLTYLNEEERFVLTKKGYFLLKDRMTNVNMDFVHDVCYKGAFHLREAIEEGKPAGLKELGDWPTIYEGLSELPERVQKSWLDFDHFFSDHSYSRAIAHVLKHQPRQLFDVGGNTGKFSMQVLDADPETHVTLLDLPGQIRLAEQNTEGYKDRLAFYPIDFLDDEAAFPPGADAIWMSQFLDCFGDEEIVSILQRARQGLNEGGRLHVLETFWDRQPFETGAFSLQQISLYFTVMANGNSQMYHSRDMIKLIREAGFSIEEEVDELGIGHTLLTCRKA